MTTSLRFGSGLLAACLFTAAHAADYSPDQFLLGDWNGNRTRLHEAGVDLQITYVNELAWNTQGGDDHTGTYSDQLMFDAALDLEKLLGWPGAGFRFTVVNRNGENLNAEADLSVLLQPQEIHGYGSVTRLVQFYYQQALLDDRLLLKLGRLPMSGEVFPFACPFQNLGFCGTVPGYITPNWYTWPISQWGATARYQLNEEWSVQTALYQVNPRFTERGQGLNFGSPSGTTGYHAVAELGWTPTFAGQPGAYRLGLWRNTGDFVDVYRDAAGRPMALSGAPAAEHDQASGGYLMAEQQLWQSTAVATRRFKLFAHFIQSDPDVTYIERIWQVGGILSAPFAGRPDDEVGLALARLEVNDDSRRRLREQGSAVPDKEYPAELYYRIAVTPAVSLSPNIQYFHQPGGYADERDSVVFGLKTVISF
ncbi:carbohydrate porin [Stutzerimonas stutzeri]|uniref:carbohydrate porin n=1 Tax=Stutzerimonas stutzeri TaxID=316 RepID=UPI001BD061F9|nr:carbohydrate porin [Stutzerimonas stutzeri]